MYEAEVNRSIESSETVPAEILERFADSRDQFTARTTLPWGEHCTECVWPTCYTSCDLYEPRPDGGCRLFIGGTVRIDHENGLSPYILKVRFKRWAKLWTVGNLHLQPMPAAGRQERRNIMMGAVSRNLPLPSHLKRRVLTKVGYVRRTQAERAPLSPDVPDAFLLECYNPNSKTIAMTLTVRARNEADTRPFQTLLQAMPGYTRARVPFNDMTRSIDVQKPFDMEIAPNDCDGTVLYFGLMDFVREVPKTAAPRVASGSAPRTLKCIVWDLDNTVWDGTVIEDGPDGVRLREGVVAVIKELDQRGILHSIASKNHFEDAMKVLQRAGLDEYFLHPQIGWHPKIQSIRKIAEDLNIGIDSLAFVDDQPFERSEVASQIGQVTVIDAADYASLLERPECRVPVTAESKGRRLMYREERHRESVLQSHAGDYLDFLRECHIRITVKRLNAANMERVYELAQRTNQLNFSGDRYSREQLAEIAQSPFLETYVMECADKFGSYGIVGFGIVETRQPLLRDLMFSCRVQGKRVEHAVLSFLLKRFLQDRTGDFHAIYRKTAKNAPAGRVFQESGFQPAGNEDDRLVFEKNREIPDDAIIELTFSEPEESRRNELARR